MIPVRKESDEVLYPLEETILVDSADLSEFKRLALLNPRKRIRLCTHRSPADNLHEMFIVHTKETYVRPHKHIGKAESFSILEGEADLVLFEDDGAIREIIRMGSPQSGQKFYHRLDSPVFHSLLIRSQVLVFHEITQGPFLRGQTVFADWAPESMEAWEWSQGIVALAEKRGVKTSKFAFETTAADRDAIAQELVTKARLDDEVKMYKHAFETTAIDRDNWAGRATVGEEQRDRMLLGLCAYIFCNELKFAPESLSERLSSNLETLALRSGLKSATQNELRNAAALGLLEATEVLLRVASVSQIALDMVETSLLLDGSFSDKLHSIDKFFHERRSFADHSKFYSTAVRDGLWPDTGTSAAQADAIDRGLPSLLLVTLPKSGSIFIWTTFSASLRMPMFRVALTQSLLEETIVPPLLRVFAKGGMTAQHHLYPSAENIAALKDAGLTRFVLHFRDPRQAAVSWWHYQKQIGAVPNRELSQEEIEAHLWRGYLVPAAEWLEGWLAVADGDANFDITLSTQEAMAGNEDSHIRMLLDRVGMPREQVDLQLSARSSGTHFRKGAKDEWLGFFSDDFRRRSRNLIPDELAERFGWIVDDA